LFGRTRAETGSLTPLDFQLRQPHPAVARFHHARTVSPGRNVSRALVIAWWSTMDRAAVAAGSTPAVAAGKTAAAEGVGL
jgi:hypothetical protein